MKTSFSDRAIAYLALLSGLSISGVAVYYSVAGLVSIFAASPIPIIVMGVALELSKLVATVWLKINWSRAPFLIKTYLIVAIALLMFITSMGIFGYLSKAHSDQNLVSGDIQAKILIYDEKIKTAKENIEASRKVLKQMDAAVDEVMSRSKDEKGADKANAIRKSQAKDRTAINKDIETNQKLIAQLNEEAAPIRAQVRKVEAEVGPIKYIAAMIYGDNPDANLLERAVRWVIIMIVSVFDPLAVILLLASQFSFQWFRQEEEVTADSFKQPISGPGPDDEVYPDEGVAVQDEPITLEDIKNDPVISEAAELSKEVAKALDEEQPLPVVTQIVEEEATFNPTQTVARSTVHIESQPAHAELKELEISVEHKPHKEVVIEETSAIDQPSGLEQWNQMIAEAEAAAEAESKANVDLEAKPDYVEDEAALEALKWAAEQQESKKKDTVTWIEREGDHQIRKTKEL